MATTLYEPYVSKSDRPRLKIAQRLKSSLFATDQTKANFLLTNGKMPPIPGKLPNQRQKRKSARQMNKF